MNTKNKSCDPILINRFFDNELEPEEHSRIGRHINECLSCRKYLEDLKGMSLRVKDHVEKEVSDTLSAQASRIETGVLDAIRGGGLPRWNRIKDRFLSKHVLIPATAIVFLILIISTVFRPPADVIPSAIITSISSDTASVIIMETPQSGHTIVWFTEDAASERLGA